MYLSVLLGFRVSMRPDRQVVFYLYRCGVVLPVVGVAGTGTNGAVAMHPGHYEEHGQSRLVTALQ